MPLLIEPTTLDGVLVIARSHFGGSRWCFSEGWDRKALECTSFRNRLNSRVKNGATDASLGVAHSDWLARAQVILTGLDVLPR